MKKFIRKWNILVFALMAPMLLFATYTYLDYQVSGSSIFRILSDGSVEIAGTLTAPDITVSDDLTVTDDLNILGSTGDNIYWGSSSASISTATTSGTSRGTIVYVYLKGTQAAIEGSLLVSTTPASTNNGVTVAVCNIAADKTGWLGIASAAASTGSIVGMYTDGFVLALATGAITAGGTLVNSTVSRGYLMTDITPTTGADVGVAMSARATTAGGLILIKLR